MIQHPRRTHLLRRWYRAKGHTKRVHRQRLDQATGRVIKEGFA